jgi:hypothetical protein
VHARADQIWPWLVQMGYGRGGLYSYDWLDRLFGYLDGPSATTILPQYQSLAEGDILPIGRGGGFPVRRVDRPRSLVFAGEAEGTRWMWEFGLYPTDVSHTRLVTRYRGQVRPGLWSKALLHLLDPAAVLMTRRMLIGIKQRAERLATSERKTEGMPS